MKRLSTQISLQERQDKALRAIYAWEYAAAMRLSDAELRKRGAFLERALRCFPWKEQGHIEYRTKLAQYNGLLDAGAARGLLPD